MRKDNVQTARRTKIQKAEKDDSLLFLWIKFDLSVCWGRHTAAAARYAISLSFHKEMAKEKERGASPFEPRAAEPRNGSRLRWLRYRFAKAALKGMIQPRLLHLEVSDLKMGGVGCKFLFGR